METKQLLTILAALTPIEYDIQQLHNLELPVEKQLQLKLLKSLYFHGIGNVRHFCSKQPQ